MLNCVNVFWCFHSDSWWILNLGGNNCKLKSGKTRSIQLGHLGGWRIADRLRHMDSQVYRKWDRENWLNAMTVIWSYLLENLQCQICRLTHLLGEAWIVTNANHSQVHNVCGCQDDKFYFWTWFYSLGHSSGHSSSVGIVEVRIDV